MDKINTTHFIRLILSDVYTNTFQLLNRTDVYIRLSAQLSGITGQLGQTNIRMYIHGLLNGFSKLYGIVSKLIRNRIKLGQKVSQYAQECPNTFSHLERIVSSVAESTENGSSIYRLSPKRIFSDYALYAYASNSGLYASAYGSCQIMPRKVA